MREQKLRKVAMAMYLEGQSPCAIYRSLNRSKKWFFKWLKRYREMGEAGLEDLSRAPNNSPNKTPEDTECLIVNVRRALMAHDTVETKYSPIGADSISWELTKLCPEQVLPSISTINRIIHRNDLLVTGKLPKRESIPYPAPKATHPNAVHQLDDVGPRYIRGSDGILKRFFSINLVDCYSRMAVLRPAESVRSRTLVNFLVSAVWTSVGIPQILQVDNMLAAKGSNRHPRSLGAMIRLCLLMGIEVLFIPVNEPQRNGAIESFNNTFDKVFLRTQRFDDLTHVGKESLAFERNYCNLRPHTGLKVHKHGSKIPAAVHFAHTVQKLPHDFSLAEYMVGSRLKIPLSPGKISFIRLVGKHNRIALFSEQFTVPDLYRHQYIKATIYTAENVLRMTHEDKVIKEESYFLTP